MSEKKATGLVFNKWPVFEIGTNLFVRVPIIVQYENTPLIQVAERVNAGYDVQIPIYHADGTYLAKVKGSRIFLTDAGRKAGVELLHPPGKTVCRIGKDVVFEIARRQAAALKTQAELHTPDGAFLRCTNLDFRPNLPGAKPSSLLIGGWKVRNLKFEGVPVGIRVLKTGGLEIKAGGGRISGRTAGGGTISTVDGGTIRIGGRRA